MGSKLDCSQGKAGCSHIDMGLSPRGIGATYALDYAKGSNTEIMVTLLFLQAAS